MIRPLIAANWKMHKTITESVDFARDLAGRFPELKDRDVVIAPPFTALSAVAQALRGSSIFPAAQNLHWEDQGAYTGEISAPMLADSGCRYVIIGHSERRTLFGDTNERVNRKLRAALRYDLKPIFCIGETLAEREAAQTFDIIEKQLKEGLNNIPTSDIRRLALAYEPVWAIGTGKTATTEQAQEVHEFIRNVLTTLHDRDQAAQVPILYGGSVKPDNIGTLMTQPDINGALVGGAGLDIESFAAIVRFDNT